MRHVGAWGFWGLMGSALVLSPVLLILGLPMAVGLGFDLVAIGGETPIILALCLPLAILVLCRLSAGAKLRRAAGWAWSRLHLDHAARAIHAP
jgi:hypothetical protein